MGLGSRHNVCLFVDDICLESLKRMSRPVIKLLWEKMGLLVPEKRDYTIGLNFEDGQTECD